MVFFECRRVLYDIEYFDKLVTQYSRVSNYEIWFRFFDNILFNIGDIFQNMINAQDNLGKGKYYEYGENVGSIVSDLFFINARDIDFVWND